MSARVALLCCVCAVGASARTSAQSAVPQPPKDTFVVKALNALTDWANGVGPQLVMERIAPGDGTSAGIKWSSKQVIDLPLGFSAKALGSTNRSWLVDAEFEASPTESSYLNFYGRFENDRSLPVYDPDRNASNQSQGVYQMKWGAVGGWGWLHPFGALHPFSIAGRGEWLYPEYGPSPAGGTFANSEFANLYPATAQSTSFLHFDAIADLNFTEPRTQIASGGWYRVKASWYVDRTRQAASFRQFSVDLRQYVPLKWRSGRALLQFSSTSSAASAGNQIPFFFLPTLGGSDTLRGFDDYRFRGPDASFVRAEYQVEIMGSRRYFPTHLLAVVFMDAGQVGTSFNDEWSHQINKDYGIGIRLPLVGIAAIAFDVAFGRENTHWNPAFPRVY
jgi:hypothetical protein